MAQFWDGQPNAINLVPFRDGLYTFLARVFGIGLPYIYIYHMLLNYGIFHVPFTVSVCMV